MPAEFVNRFAVLCLARIEIAFGQDAPQNINFYSLGTQAGPYCELFGILTQDFPAFQGERSETELKFEAFWPGRLAKYKPSTLETIA